MSLSLPQVLPPPTPATRAPTPSTHGRKKLRLSDLAAGQTGRILRVSIPDQGCRKRFAELGLAEGMKVTVASTGDTMMLLIGTAKMGLAARCADEITVVRI